MAAKGTNTTKKKNVSSNVATQKANSATMAARYSTPSSSVGKSTNTSATKNVNTNTTASKANTVTASTATKNTYTAPTVSKANNVTASTAVKNTPAGAGSSSSSSYSSSTSSNVNKAAAPTTVKYNNTVQEMANAQKAANESYVNNLLAQLKNQGGVSGMLNANTNANMSPSQRTTAMLNTISGLGRLTPGVGLATGLNPNQSVGARTLLQTLANDTSEDKKPSENISDLFTYQPTVSQTSAADLLTNGVTRTPSNVQERLGIYSTTPNAMAGDPRYQVQQDYSNKTLSDVIANAARNALVESVDNPNANAPFIETPSALVGQSLYDSLVNPVTAVDKDKVDLGAMAGDSRYVAQSNPKSLSDAIARAAANTLSDYGVTGNKDVLDNLNTYERVNSALNPGAYSAGDLVSNLINVDESGEGGTGGTGGSSSRTSSYSRSGSGSGTALGDGSIDISTLYDLLNQRLGEYDANFDEMMAALMDNYNMNFQSLEDAYAAALNRLGGNYADTEALLNSSLANSQRSLEDERTRALQEAYIARMMQEKNLSDQLDAYGLSGGATESVLADMRNNYNNNRNSIEAKVQESLRDLLQQYMTNLSDARGRYNDSLLNAETNRLNAIQNLSNSMSQAQNNVINQRSNARAGAYEDLYNTLANLTMKGINYV